MYERPAAPQPIGGVVDDAIRLYRSSFSSTWKLSLGFSLLLALAAIPIALVSPGLTSGLRMTPQQSLQILSSPVLQLGYLVMVLVGALFYSSLLACQAAVARGTPLTTGQALAAGLRRLPGFLLGGIVFVIVLTVGFVLLFIPGIYLWGKFELWPAALFADDATAMQSLSRSWNLTQGRWWRTVTIVTVGLIILYVVALAVGLLSGIIIGLVGLKGGSLVMAQLVVLPVGILSRIFLAPAVPAVLLAVYHDCKLRSEGGDLAERAANLTHA